MLHKTIKKVSHDTERLEFNTAIAQMMIFLNEVGGPGEACRGSSGRRSSCCSPRTLRTWRRSCGRSWATRPPSRTQPWPEWIEALTVEDLVEVVFQINGKIRAKESLPAGTSEEQIREKALGHERIRELLAGRRSARSSWCPNKLVNIVAAL